MLAETCHAASRAQWDMTAMCIAAQHGWLDAVQLLARAGAHMGSRRKVGL